MKNTLETRLGIFFALAFIAAVVVLELAGGLDLFKHGYQISGFFKDVHELKVGDPVKMAGVQVGKVEKISLSEKEEKVKVTIKVTNPDAEIKTDSKATVKFAGL